MARSKVVAWYKQSVGFGWRALIRNQASASHPIPQADCYLSPPLSSCKLHLLSTEGKKEGVGGSTGGFSSACGYAFMNKCLCARQSMCPPSGCSVTILEKKKGWKRHPWIAFSCINAGIFHGFFFTTEQNDKFQLLQIQYSLYHAYTVYEIDGIDKKICCTNKNVFGGTF